MKRVSVFPDQQPGTSQVVLTAKDFEFLLSDQEMDEDDIPATTKKSVEPFQSLLGLRLDRSGFESVLIRHEERHTCPENMSDTTIRPDESNPPRASSRKRNRPSRFIQRVADENTPNVTPSGTFSSTRTYKRDLHSSPYTHFSSEPRAGAVRSEHSSRRRVSASKALHQDDYIQALERRIVLLERHNQYLLLRLHNTANVATD